MTKKELVSAIAEKTGLTKKDSAVALDAALEAVTEALCEGEKVALVGFGVFETRERAARTGVNPFTKEEMETPAARVPKFTASKTLKNAVNK